MAKTAKKPQKKAKTFTATGKTLDEAVEKAHAQIPPNPRISDEIIKSKIVSAGRRTGGIAGFQGLLRGGRADRETIERRGECPAALAIGHLQMIFDEKGLGQPSPLREPRPRELPSAACVLERFPAELNRGFPIVRE